MTQLTRLFEPENIGKMQLRNRLVMAEVGDRVVVVGGRYLGMETAILLAPRGKKVSLVTERQLGQNDRFIERNIRLPLRDRLIECGVYLHTDSPLSQIRDDGVYVVNSRELTFLRADTVVLAVGARPRNRLVQALKGVVPELYAMEAIGEAAEVARQI